jgi:hypothetical protein
LKLRFIGLERGTGKSGGPRGALERAELGHLGDEDGRAAEPDDAHGDADVKAAADAETGRDKGGDRRVELVVMAIENAALKDASELPSSRSRSS